MEQDLTWAEELWADLYLATFARSRHEKLWLAMADLSDEEKYRVDQDAEAIIARHLNEPRAEIEAQNDGYNAAINDCLGLIRKYLFLTNKEAFACEAEMRKLVKE